MIQRRRFLFGLSLILLFGAGAVPLFTNDPASGASRTLRMQLGQTVRDFMSTNRLQEGTGYPSEYTIPVDKIEDRMPIFFDNDWVRLIFEDSSNTLNLPPGRSLIVNQSAGVIVGLAFTPYGQPFPFENADKHARELIEDFVRKGWKTAFLHYPASENDSNLANNAKIYATLVSISGCELTLTLKDLSRMPRFDVNIPGSAPFAPADPTPRYIMQIEIVAPESIRQMRDDYVSARRLAVNGPSGGRLGLRVWLDDPDWTPAKLGMKQVEVPNPDWNAAKPWLGKKLIKRWSMPDGRIQP